MSEGMRRVDQYQAKEKAYLRAFRDIVTRLGPEHQLSRFIGQLAFGQLAFGQHDAEGGPDDNKLRDVVMRYGYLRGRADAVSIWCETQGQFRVLTRWRGSLSREGL